MEKLKKSRLWLMCGTPGSGKSTWIQEHKNYFAEDCKVISRDAIRFSLLTREDEFYFSKEKEVWKEYVKQAEESLSTNIDTILDATHLSPGSRSKICIALGAKLKDVEVNVIVVNTSLDIALAQNEQRKGTRAYVPRGAIRRMSAQFIMPTIEEGFDHIYIYTKEGDKVKYQILDKE